MYQEKKKKENNRGTFYGKTDQNDFYQLPLLPTYNSSYFYGRSSIGTLTPSLRTLCSYLQVYHLENRNAC
jgi:hypothetical protein